MRRRAIKRRRPDPANRVRNRVEAFGNDGKRERELISRLLQSHIIEPQHPTFAGRKLRTVVVVEREVAMRYGTGMVVIRFVDVFGQDDGRQGEPRREYEDDSRSPGRMH